MSSTFKFKKIILVIRSFWIASPALILSAAFFTKFKNSSLLSLSFTQKTLESRWFGDIRKMISAHTKSLNGKHEVYNGIIVTNFSPHYDENNPTSSGGYVLTMNHNVLNDLKAEPEGILMGMLHNAINGYGTVPPDMSLN